MGISGRVIIEKRGNGADNTFHPAVTGLSLVPEESGHWHGNATGRTRFNCRRTEKIRPSGVSFDAALQNRVTNQQWAERICSLKPDMIGFSTTTSAFLDAYDVCLKVKEISPDIKTVFGGVHVSWGKEKILEAFRLSIMLSQVKVKQR